MIPRSDLLIPGSLIPGRAGSGMTARLWGHPIVAFATDTVYGLGCLLGDSAGIDALYAAKGRSTSQPAQLLVSDSKMARRYVAAGDDDPVDADSRLYLLRRECLEGWDARLIKDGKVSVRCPKQSALCRLIARVDLPMVASSANRRGQPPLLCGDGVRREFAGIPLIVDDDCGVSGQPSAIWDMSTAPPTRLR